MRHPTLVPRVSKKRLEIDEFSVDTTIGAMGGRFELGMVPIDRQGKELLCLIRAGATWFESVRLDNEWGVEDTETMSLFHETHHLLTIGTIF